MTFDKINRRTHLYAGIVLAPWFLVYALSSLFLNHGELFPNAHGSPNPKWTKRYERPYHLAMTKDSTPWKLAPQLLKDQGMEGRHRASFDQDGDLVVLRNRLTGTSRLTYFPAEKRLLVEDKGFEFQELVTASHFRAGYEQPYLSELLWAVFVDGLAFFTLIWVITGLYIWWHLKQLRFWGALSLVAGFLSFAVIVLGL